MFKNRDSGQRSWYKADIFLYIGFLLLVFLIYGQSLFGQFVYDDGPLILKNPNVHSLSDFWRTLSLPYWSGSKSNALVYRPIVSWTFIINWVIGKGNPFWFHLTNLLLHWLNGILLFKLLNKLGIKWMAATIITLLFLIHPLQTEAVENIANRTEVIATTFILTSMILFDRRSYLVPIFFILGLLSKENAIVLPGLLFALYITDRKHYNTKYLINISILSLVALSGYFFLRHHVLGHFIGASTVTILDNPLNHAPILVRLKTAAWILVKYLGLIIAPINQSADYSYNQISLVTGWLNLKWILGLILILTSIFLVVNRRINKNIRLGLMIFFVGISLTSNLIIPISNIMAERFLYFPIIGVLLAIYGAIPASQIQQRGFLFPTIALIIFYSFLSLQRTKIWLTNDLLGISMIESAPNSARANFLYSVSLFKFGHYNESKSYLGKALSIFPPYTYPYTLLTDIYFKQGKIDSAKWAIDQAYQIDPNPKLKAMQADVYARVDSIKAHLKDDK